MNWPERGGRGFRRAGVTKGRSMSTFDDPFDSNRELARAGCVCGQHRSAAEHEHATLALRCEPVESEQKRYEGVVASAVVRALFPKVPRPPPLSELPRRLDRAPRDL